MNKKPIRVLLVEDSPVATLILKRLLDAAPEIEIVGTARTGVEGLELIPKLRPDVICTDLHMPKMDGLEFTREVMANFPRPILVISSSVQAEDTHNVFKLLKAGAVDVFPKPRDRMLCQGDPLAQELITKIKVLSGVAVFTLRRRHETNSEPPRSKLTSPKSSPGLNPVKPRTPVSSPLRKTPPAPSPHLGTPPPRPRPSLEPKPEVVESQRATPYIRMVAIGASTGGPQALHAILTQLPANFPVPVVCVQHISHGFLQGLVDWLNSECALTVTIAQMGQRPQAGQVYFPPEGKHLELDRSGQFWYSSAPPLSGHRPSVTVTFEAVAKFYGRSALGILLTGMGRDGADGMDAIARNGGVTIAQNEATCVVFGMPKEAIALGAARYVLPINDIAPILLDKIVLHRL
jgi:two-component system chemotaxis response regulator CheB